MLHRLLGAFLAFTLLGGVLTLPSAPTWASAIISSIFLGAYMVSCLVAAGTWAAARGRPLQGMTLFFGADAPTVLHSFHDHYRNHKGIVASAALLTSLGWGVGLWLWIQVGYFRFAFTPTSLVVLSCGAALLGALAGPGFALLGLYSFYGSTSEAKQRPKDPPPKSDEPSSSKQRSVRKVIFWYAIIYTSGGIFLAHQAPFAAPPDLPQPPPGKDSLLSPYTWKMGAWAWILSIWNEIHIILPMGLTWGGLVFRGLVLAEEKKWIHAATLIPGLLQDGETEHTSTDTPSLLWHAYDRSRDWAPYLCVPLGLGAGIVQAVWPLFPSLPLSATLGLSALAAVLVSVAAVGWLTTLVVFFRGPTLGS